MRNGLSAALGADDREPSNRWAVAGVCLAAGLVLGFAVVRLEPLILVLLAGVILVPGLIAARPVAGLLLLMAGTTFMSIYKGLPHIPVKSISVPDLLLFLLYGIFGWKWATGRIRYAHTPMEKPYLGLMVAASLSLFYWTVLGGTNFFEAIREFKVLLYYSLFILVPGLTGTAGGLRLFIGACLGLGVLAAMNLIAGALVYPPAASASGEEFYYGFRGLVGDGGVLLVYWSLCCAFSCLLLSGLRVTWLVALGSYLLFYLLKFHRHMYIIIALSMIAAALLAFPGNRKRVLQAGVAALAALLLLGGLLAWGPRSLGRYAALSVERLESLHGIQSTRTVTMRLLENRHAMATIRAHPLIGIGFAKSYRPSIYGPDDRMNAFVHNGYLSILLKTGWAGFLLFLWFSWRFIRRGFLSWRGLNDPVLRAAVLGSAIAYVGMAAANLTSPYFMQDWGVAAIGLMIGITEAAIQFAAAPARKGAPA